MLQPNDTIALFCTGSSSLHKKEPQQVAAYLATQQLNTVFAVDTYKTTAAKQRAAIFLDYVFNNEMKILWALRGGEGTADTIPYIHQYQQQIKKLPPKPIVGFSDITALLIYFAQLYHWPVVHGPGALQLVHQHVTKHSKQTVLNYLHTQQMTTPPKLIPLNQAAMKRKTLRGEWIGGNLSLLNISIGDQWELETTQKIVLIEEVNEKPHAIHRTLNYLTRLGKFDHAKAIVLGEFLLKNADSTMKRTIKQVLINFAKEQRIPVFKTNQIGHGIRNIAMPFATPLSIQLA